MRVLMINVVCGVRSTGRICADLAQELEANGHEVKIAYGREDVPKQIEKYAFKIGKRKDVYMHGLGARLLDKSGFGSRKVTKEFIRWIKSFDPDVIHLHNLHGYYINISILFDYLKDSEKKIIWTLHDCWAFTGHCVYFDYVGCKKWMKECNHCEQKKEYPSCVGLDGSRRNFRNKKSLFCQVPNMTLVTPSSWLAELVKRSYLKDYPIKIINNGINTTTFKPSLNNLRERYQLLGKTIVLGVAAIWDRRKGLDYLVELSKRINKQCVVVVIGLTEEQKRELPNNMVGILKTSSVQELVDWYSTADIFVNPTLEDNYPSTNLEAISCGTPVITFSTGGSPESAEMYGQVVSSLDEMVDLINDYFKKKTDFKKKTHDFSIQHMVAEYIKLYAVS